MSRRFLSHSLAVLLLLTVTAALASTALFSMLAITEPPVHDVLTGALAATVQVGYVAVKDKVVLESAMESVRRYPVTLETGTFRGHYFLKIKGDPNTVRAATLAAATTADLHQGLVFSGIQLE